jgi:hypothetical protein
MEKHWKSVVSRSVCDYFFDQQRKVGSPEDMPPVIATPHHYLISIHRCCMFFVAVCMTEGWLFFVHESDKNRIVMCGTLVQFNLIRTCDRFCLTFETCFPNHETQ